MRLSARMPDLRAFEVLVAIAKTGSLGAAAREVGLTQQAVSVQVASMEAQIGVRLVVRTARGSQMTPARVPWDDRLSATSVGRICRPLGRVSVGGTCHER
jgi:hypothetical protein